jgi:lipopolysaccharide transport protein LptA
MIGLLLTIALLAKPPAKPDGGVARPKGKSGIVVDAVNLEVLNKPESARRAIWKGNVVAHRDDVLMKCDRMEAELTPDDRIERATCDGHVEATKAENYLAGKHADFDNVHGILVMKGDPHGHQGETQVSGETITFFVDENKLNVEKSHMSLPSEKMDREGANPKTPDGGK